MKYEYLGMTPLRANPSKNALNLVHFVGCNEALMLLQQQDASNHLCDGRLRDRQGNIIETCELLRKINTSSNACEL